MRISRYILIFLAIAIPAAGEEKFPMAGSFVVSDPLAIQSSRSAAGQFNALVIFLADQLERNLERKASTATIAVASFVNLNNLDETSGLGRLLAENLIHELQMRRWSVTDLHLTREMVIAETGEFNLSRDTAKLRGAPKSGTVVTGTYTVAGPAIIINARAMDIASGSVLSSAQMALPLNRFTNALLVNMDEVKPMQIRGDQP